MSGSAAAARSVGTRTQSWACSGLEWKRCLLLVRSSESSISTGTSFRTGATKKGESFPQRKECETFCRSKSLEILSHAPDSEFCKNFHHNSGFVASTLTIPPVFFLERLYDFFVTIVARVAPTELVSTDYVFGGTWAVFRFVAIIVESDGGVVCAISPFHVRRALGDNPRFQAWTTKMQTERPKNIPCSKLTIITSICSRYGSCSYKIEVALPPGPPSERSEKCSSHHFVPAPFTGEGKRANVPKMTPASTKR
eukprot:scaffold34621_cov166-Amphora_coffeaeformis.AAC.13